MLCHNLLDIVLDNFLLWSHKVPHNQPTSIFTSSLPCFLLSFLFKVQPLCTACPCSQAGAGAGSAHGEPVTWGFQGLAQLYCVHWSGANSGCRSTLRTSVLFLGSKHKKTVPSSRFCMPKAPRPTLARHEPLWGIENPQSLVGRGKNAGNRFL